MKRITGDQGHHILFRSRVHDPTVHSIDDENAPNFVLEDCAACRFEVYRVAHFDISESCEKRVTMRRQHDISLLARFGAARRMTDGAPERSLVKTLFNVAGDMQA